jgi:hypothetical protein
MLPRSKLVNLNRNLNGNLHDNQAPCQSGSIYSRNRCSQGVGCMHAHAQVHDHVHVHVREMASCGHGSGARKQPRYRGRSDAVGTTRDLVTIVRVRFRVALTVDQLGRTRTTLVVPPSRGGRSVAGKCQSVSLMNRQDQQGRNSD